MGRDWTPGIEAAKAAMQLHAVFFASGFALNGRAGRGPQGRRCLAGKSNPFGSAHPDWTREAVRKLNESRHTMSKPTGAVAPIVAVFSQSIEVRVIVLDDDPWFVASDVAAALDYRNAPDMTRNLDDDEKGTHNLRTLGGTQALSIISESGLYAAVLKSRKPEAKKFRKWVTNEVLPQIRKTGTYNLPAAKCQHDYLTGDDMRALTRLVWMIAGMIGERARHAIWHALRVVSGCAAPNRFEVKHIPDLATELRRLYVIVTRYRETQLAAEEAILKSCIRGREKDDTVLAELLDRITTEATNAVHSYTLVVNEGSLCNFFDRSLMAFIQRTDPVNTEYPGYEEPQAGSKIRRREDLSFTHRDENGFLRNWVVPHDPVGDWSEGWHAGAAMFEEVTELAKVGEKSAYDAIRHPLSQDQGFRREGWGIECGFADEVARAAIDGLRARRMGLQAFDPKAKPVAKSSRAALPKKGKTPALPNGEQAIARLAAEVAAI